MKEEENELTVVWRKPIYVLTDSYLEAFVKKKRKLEELTELIDKFAIDHGLDRNEAMQEIKMAFPSTPINHLKILMEDQSKESEDTHQHADPS